MVTKYIYELTELEKTTLVTLAERGPMSGYDFHLGSMRERGARKALMSSGTWHKILENIGPKKLNLIEPIQKRGSSSSDQRGRRKDLYWLTSEGVIYAIYHGASIDKTKKALGKIRPQDEDTIFLLEMADALGVPWVLRTYESYKSSKSGNMILNSIPLEQHKIQKFIKVLKKHPEQFQALKKLFKEIAPRLPELLDQE